MKRKNKSLFSFIIVLLLAIVSIYCNNFFKDTDNGDVLKRETVNTTGNFDDNLVVSYLNVGQADSILIEINNKYALIDAGNNADGEKLVKYFKDLGISRFDYVIATHGHEDHIGGMDDIINNFDIGKFYMPNYITTTKTFEDVLDALKTKNIGINVPKVGETFSLDKADFEILASNSDAKNINDTSIVLKATYGLNKFLFMGDLSSSEESKLLDKSIAVDVLKVGHHGSKYSTSSEFLDKVSPQYAIISVGKNNNYKHPHSSTLAKLKNRNIKVYRTDLDGTIRATSNGTVVKIDTLNTDVNG